MDDPLVVRGLECLGDLRGDLERLDDREASCDDPIGQRRAIDQLHDQRTRAIEFLEAVDLPDVRVIERGEQLRLATEAREAILVGRPTTRAGL